MVDPGSGFEAEEVSADLIAQVEAMEGSVNQLTPQLLISLAAAATVPAPDPWAEAEAEARDWGDMGWIDYTNQEWQWKAPCQEGWTEDDWDGQGWQTQPWQAQDKVPMKLWPAKGTKVGNTGWYDTEGAVRQWWTRWQSWSSSVSGSASSSSQATAEGWKDVLCTRCGERIGCTVRDDRPHKKRRQLLPPVPVFDQDQSHEEHGPAEEAAGQPSARPGPEAEM